MGETDWNSSIFNSLFYWKSEAFQAWAFKKRVASARISILGSSFPSQFPWPTFLTPASSKSLRPMIDPHTQLPISYPLLVVFIHSKCNVSQTEHVFFSKSHHFYPVIQASNQGILLDFCLSFLSYIQILLILFFKYLLNLLLLFYCGSLIFLVLSFSEVIVWLYNLISWSW